MLLTRGAPLLFGKLWLLSAGFLKTAADRPRYRARGEAWLSTKVLVLAKPPAMPVICWPPLKSNQPKTQVALELAPFDTLPPSKLPGKSSLFSSANMKWPRASCLLLFITYTPAALAFALDSAGSSKPARIAMMAMTTRSSMSVNAHRRYCLREGERRLAELRSFIG